jgi:geranylgeranyl reductase family protein
MIDAEITIIGAGPGGSTAALSLAKRGIRVLLIDQATFPRDKVCGDALSGKVVLTLKRLNEDFPKNLSIEPSVIASHGVSFVAPNGKVLNVSFRREPDPENPPGFIAKRLDFDNWLFNKAASHPLIKIETGIRIENFERENDGWLLSDKENKFSVRTKLVIAADGAHSRFAKEVGGIVMEDEHYCAGLRGYYSGVKDLDQNGFIELHFTKEFLPGYFWIFPLANGLANVGVGMRSDVVAKKKINLRKEMQKLIETHPLLKERFKDATLMDSIKGYGLPLGSKKRPLSGDGFLLIGDAGALIDPFTGEGIGNAMICGLKAGEIVADIKNNIYSKEALKAYDESVYKRLWPELSLSKKMQELVKYPWLFNLVVNRANNSKTLRETISCMFEDLDLRGRLENPIFYLKVLFERG